MSQTARTVPLLLADAAAVAHALVDRPGLAWLDGAEETGSAGALSFVTSDPVEVRRAEFGDRDPLAALDGISPDGRAGGVGPDARAPRWIGFFAYDLAWAGATRTPPRHARSESAPVLWLARYDAVAAFDAALKQAWIIGDDEAACDRLRARIQAGAGARSLRVSVGAPRVAPGHEHVEAVRRALGHIEAGDVYQVNLARRWRAAASGDPLALFLAMRSASPVPFGFFLDAGEIAVLARTMERFLSWEGSGGALVTRPIKGTIARTGEDEREALALVSDEKERAEHAMIVDLMRNDLGRVAATGSVSVTEAMAVEPYARLSHLVSTVSCRTRPDVRLGDVVRATFPPGSVTGAPKVSAVEIIEALEPVPRGVYCGAVGFVDRAGGCSFAVAIRTAQVFRSAQDGEVVYHAGGGIVSASDPEKELAETELKARAFLDALDALTRSRSAEPADTRAPAR